MGNAGTDEFLFRQRFVNQVLHGGVHVASEVGLNDLLSKLSKQRGLYAVASQVYEQVIFRGQNLGLLFHAKSLGAHAYAENCLKSRRPNDL